MSSHRYRKAIKFKAIFIIVLLVGILTTFSAGALEPEKAEDAPRITAAQDMGGVVKREAGKIKNDLREQTKSLFHRDRLGWDFGSIKHLYTSALTLPKELPGLTKKTIESSRLLGFLGSALILLFFSALLYSIIGRSRMLGWAMHKLEPFGKHIPERFKALYIACLNILVSALIPIVLLSLFSLISKIIQYEASWFQLVGRMLELWAIGSLILAFLKEIFTGYLIKETNQHGKTLFFYARLLVFYIFSGIAVFWVVEVFKVRTEILALIKFAIAVSIAVVCFLFFMKKEAILSLLPVVPFSIYTRFLSLLKKAYHPLLMISMAVALLWCLGYHNLGVMVLSKIWFTIATFWGLLLLYYGVRKQVDLWAGKTNPDDETAKMLVGATKSLIKYMAIVASGLIVLSLLGLLDPIERIMSFPIFKLGDNTVTLWILIKATLILLAFIYASRLLQTYFDYKIFPFLGIDSGLAYALNTMFKYLSIGIGVLISLNFVGIDLRFLMVFAGAAGIGIGFGLQNLAANMVSGFIIIFGGKIRKGDWIEVSNTMGMVSDVHLTYTKVNSRTDIEYLIPNSELISSTLVNYTLSSPFIRIDLPVGVSYNSPPREVERILLEAAAKEPMVSKIAPPAVRFIEYADNSINFILWISIDVRKVAHQQVRSELYFAIFEEFKKKGIEIPFPQRDIHIRSKA
ncbi:MAG: mechanosensitive ion channel [Proteobacteria bacterium]|nr:mechanosensitive ion channel [Pseudomonadota bacterium]MBU4471416.1 mechanosensitive ion channel [Pseudomonadota bacterium]MCG2752421.1 mechanosensitive ion channel [Desulfobacteraceae bacterium]